MTAGPFASLASCQLPVGTLGSQPPPHKAKSAVWAAPPRAASCLTACTAHPRCAPSLLCPPLQAANLLDLFGPDFEGTVFAPTDDAFKAALEVAAAAGINVLDNTDLLAEILVSRWLACNCFRC